MSRAQSGSRQRSAEALKVPKISAASLILKWKEFGITTPIRDEQSDPFGEKGRCWGPEWDRAELQSLCADRRELQKVTEPVCVSPHGYISFAVELAPVEGSRAQQGPLSGKQHHVGGSHLGVAPPAASGPCNNAAPAFVQLGVMSADVVPYIPQSKESLTAELHAESRKRIISTEAHEDNGEGLMC